FSDELPIETIKSQFLNTLDQSYTLENNGDEWNRAITKESIEDLGRSIKNSVDESKRNDYGSDLTEGFNNLNLSLDSILKPLSRSCFKGKHLIAIGKTEWGDLQWSDSSIATKKNIINKADIVFNESESITTFNNSKNKKKNKKIHSHRLK